MCVQVHEKDYTYVITSIPSTRKYKTKWDGCRVSLDLTLLFIILVNQHKCN
jgi:hypothetical protein